METNYTSQTISNNSIAFVALCNEYCAAIEQAQGAKRQEFVTCMLRILPRIYIAATDLNRELTDDTDSYVAQALEEEVYDSVRGNVEAIMGATDTYLEVFEDDMKYSDTPIAASVSEGLADLYQVFYNMLATVRDAPAELISEVLKAVSDDFGEYWSRILCNVLRALNHIRYGLSDDFEEE